MPPFFLSGEVERRSPRPRVGGYIRKMRRQLPGLAAALGVLWGAALLADAALDAARSELARERRLLASDTTRLADVSRRLEAALSELAAASRAAAESVTRGEAGSDEVARREDAVASAEQNVRSLLDRRRILAERILDRRRTITALEDEAQTRRTTDALTGRWAVVLDPGEQRGVFRMNLQGTIVSGEYTLEGGYTGSLRGTLVSERLRLERVDSKLGFTAVLHGRLSRDGQITGTWEATTYGTGGAGNGRWRAVREEEREESP